MNLFEKPDHFLSYWKFMSKLTRWNFLELVIYSLIHSWRRENNQCKMIFMKLEAEYRCYYVAINYSHGKCVFFLFFDRKKFYYSFEDDWGVVDIFLVLCYWHHFSHDLKYVIIRWTISFPVPTKQKLSWLPENLTIENTKALSVLKNMSENIEVNNRGNLMKSLNI